MKKTKLKRLFSIQEKLYNRNSDKFKSTKNRIHKINSEIFVAQYDELFFVKVENALKNGWSCNAEANYWLRLVDEAKDGDEDSLKLLRAEFKFNDAFKSKTGAFKNV